MSEKALQTAEKTREVKGKGEQERSVHFSSVTQSCPIFATLWTVTRQAPLCEGFSRQEYWSGLPCPPPGDLPNPEAKPTSLISLAWQAVSLPLAPLGKLI